MTLMQPWLPHYQPHQSCEDATQEHPIKRTQGLQRTCKLQRILVLPPDKSGPLWWWTEQIMTWRCRSSWVRRAHIYHSSEEGPHTITWNLRGRWMPNSLVVQLTMNCTCNWEAEEAGSLYELPKVLKLDVPLCLIVPLWPSPCTSCPSSSQVYWPHGYVVGQTSSYVCNLRPLLSLPWHSLGRWDRSVLQCGIIIHLHSKR